MARCVPWTVHSYHLEELITTPELRANIAALFRKYADVKTPEVIDLLIYKGRGELEVRQLGVVASVCSSLSFLQFSLQAIWLWTY